MALTPYPPPPFCNFLIFNKCHQLHAINQISTAAMHLCIDCDCRECANLNHVEESSSCTCNLDRMHPHDAKTQLLPATLHQHTEGSKWGRECTNIQKVSNACGIRSGSGSGRAARPTTGCCTRLHDATANFYAACARVNSTAGTGGEGLSPLLRLHLLHGGHSPRASWTSFHWLHLCIHHRSIFLLHHDQVNIGRHLGHFFEQSSFC